MNKEQKKTAYHEAGHAVIARILSIKVNLVSILPFKTTIGQVEVIANGETDTNCPEHPATAGYSTDAYEKNIMMSMAGDAAHFRHLIEIGHKKIDTGNGDREDRIQSTYLAFHIVALKHGIALGKPPERLPKHLIPEVHAVLERLTSKTMALVNEHWSAISRVAEALIERHVLYSEDIDALITDKPNLSDVLDAAMM